MGFTPYVGSKASARHTLSSESASLRWEYGCGVDSSTPTSLPWLFYPYRGDGEGEWVWMFGRGLIGWGIPHTHSIHNPSPLPSLKPPEKGWGNG